MSDQATERAVTDEDRAAQRAAWKKAISGKNAAQRRGRVRRKPAGITGVRAAPVPVARERDSDAAEQQETGILEGGS